MIELSMKVVQPWPKFLRLAIKKKMKMVALASINGSGGSENTKNTTTNNNATNTNPLTSPTQSPPSSSTTILAKSLHSVLQLDGIVISPNLSKSTEALHDAQLQQQQQQQQRQVNDSSSLLSPMSSPSHANHASSSSSSSSSSHHRFVDYDTMLEILIESYLDEDARMHHMLYDLFLMQNPSMTGMMTNNVNVPSSPHASSSAVNDPTTASSALSSIPLEPEMFSFHHFSDVLQALGYTWSEESVLEIYSYAIQHAHNRAVTITDLVETARCYGVMPVQVEMMNEEDSEENGKGSGEDGRNPNSIDADGLLPSLDISERTSRRSSQRYGSQFDNNNGMSTTPPTNSTPIASTTSTARSRHMIQSLRDRIHTLESTSHERMQLMTSRYEKEMREMKEKYEREIESIKLKNAELMAENKVDGGEI